jgi:tetratricopeptide (TPR) repeat protein
MRSTWIILLVFTGVLISHHSFAQEQEKAKKSSSKKDSYSSVKSRANTSDIQRLLSDAEKIKVSDPRAALENVQEALAMSIAEEDLFNEGKSYLLLGEINENIQEWKLALDNYFNAYQKISQAENTSDRKKISKVISADDESSELKKALNGLGRTALKLGQFDDALTHYRELLTKDLNPIEEGECQLNISEVYYGMKNYDEALKAVNSIQYNSKSGNSSLEVRIKNQQAKIYAQQNQLDKTQKFYSNSLQSQRASGAAAPSSNSAAQDQLSTQEAKEEISAVLKDQGKYDDEINLRKQSIEYNLETENLPEVSRDKVAISESFAAKGDIPEAIKEAEEAAVIADTIENPKEQANAYLALADLYEKNNSNSKALTAYKKYSKAVAKAEELNQERLTEKSELIQKQQDIEQLSKDVSIGQREAKIHDQTVFRQQLIIYGLLLIIMIIAVAAYFIYRSAQASKTANQMLALKSLRSQMNPHFIFNALNSVNHFVAQQDERTANKFLSEFSQLMRLVLENSQEDFIPLFKEQEILTLYLKLEHYRFRDKFDYEINIDENISTETVEVPPMLIQPYIENAVWHGLRYKETKGKLTLNISVENNFLVVEVMDDGIGRKKSVELKTTNQRKHNSTGLKNIQERLQIINKVYKTHYRVDIEDVTEQGGTRVRIYLPITKTQAA